ncbi:MAG: hypothetical protein ACK5MZ_04190 [Aestuariibaculum sp.]
MGFVVGNRGSETGRELWRQIEQCTTGKVMADYWKVYNDVIPAEKLIQTKKETYTVERYNGLYRHY